VTIPLALRGIRVQRRFRPAVLRLPDVCESSLTIRRVESFDVDDPAQIGWYQLTDLAFASPRVTLATAQECTVALEVSSLEVECELRMEPYEWSEPGATALVVPFRAAEPVIGEHRRSHTPSGKEGMPAHVTVLAPFVHSSRLDSLDRHRVRDTVRRFNAFDVRLSTFGLFEHIGCLYLEPRPREPFVALTEALVEMYPEIDHLPEGASEIVPHVTVGGRLTPEQQEEIRRDVTPRLPVRTRVDRVVLYERRQDGRWFDRQTFALS
jgi:hypothetical protein